MMFVRKPTRPSLPLRKAPHLSPSLSLLRRERMCQPPFNSLYDPFGSPCRGQKRCSEPLHSKVGGPSEVYASSRAAFFCAGINPPSLKDLLRASAPSGRADCVSFCPNTIPESESSIPDLSHQAAEGGQIAVFEQGIVAGIGCLVVGLQGVEDFADFLKFLTVRRYGLEGMTGEQIDLGQL